MAALRSRDNAARTGSAPFVREEDEHQREGKRKPVHQPCRSLPHPLNWEQRNVFIVERERRLMQRELRRCARPPLACSERSRPEAADTTPSAGAAAA